jgi:hypothetical protein
MMKARDLPLSAPKKSPAAKRRFRGVSDARGFRAGAGFTLRDHYRADINMDHLLVEVTHEGSQSFATSDLDDHPTASYTNQFITMPAATVFRPPRLTRKPVIAGSLTAKIDGASDGTPDASFSTLRLPPKRPQANGYMERWFRTVKTNLIRKAYWLDAEALWQALALYLEHYHSERPHQSLDNLPPVPSERSTIAGHWTMVRHQRIGGLINAYRREEAA